jgi:RNA polymerase sigma-70 factor (ECF subfamily)
MHDDLVRMDANAVYRVSDDELRMMFTCAHPALDGASQLALTLRLISGLTVDEIARALLHSEAAVGQRITNAKNKIRGANIPLRVPPAELLPHRVPHVLACNYSVFTEGYWSTAGPSAIRDELCDEGVRLGGEMPGEPDAHALAALMLLHDSRRTTRVDDAEALVPLDEQDRGRWDHGRIARGLHQLRLAEGAPGAYLPQAVIAAVHATATARTCCDERGGTRRPPAGIEPLWNTTAPNRHANFFGGGFQTNEDANDRLLPWPRTVAISTDACDVAMA